VGVLGEMFPSRKLRSEAGEAGSGQVWRLGPIDLEKGVIDFHLAEPHPEPGEDDDRPAGSDSPSPSRRPE
jgi:hypothetical protein